MNLLDLAFAAILMKCVELRSFVRSVLSGISYSSASVCSLHGKYGEIRIVSTVSGLYQASVQIQ